MRALIADFLIKDRFTPLSGRRRGVAMARPHWPADVCSALKQQGLLLFLPDSHS